MDGTERASERHRRPHRLWWWAAGSVACALVVPLAAATSGAQAAPGARSAAAEGARPAAAAVCTGAVYTVVAGDGWYLIASKNGVAVAALLAANNATVATPLFPGQRLCLPPATGATSTTAPGATTTAAPTPPTPTVTIAQFPVQGMCYFTDTFGAPRSGGRTHAGVDIIAKSGLYLYAVADGTLTKQYIDAPGSLAGNGWRLTRADGTYFFYAHLSAFAPGLAVGSAVKAGQILGYVGMTGNAGTPHLHFEVHPGGGVAINPTPVVKAVDGCKVTTVPAQPGGPAPTTTVITSPPSTPTSPPSTPTTTTTAPSPTAPTTTVTPPSTAPGPTPTTAAPATTVPPGGGPGLRWQFATSVLAYDSGGAKLAAGTAVTVRVDSLPGIPAGTPGVMVRVMARNVAGAGYLAVHTCEAGANGTTTLAVQPNRLNATMTVAAVAGGAICVTSSVALDLRVYVVGYQAAEGVGAQPIATKRALDTRSGAKPAANANTAISPAKLGMPLGSKAVTANLTLLAPDAAGALGIGPCGGTPWIVNFTAGGPQVLSGVFRTNDAGLCITSTVPVHLVVDVTAVWRTTAGALPAVPPVRVVDSRPAGVTSAGKVVGSGAPTGATRAQYTITLVAGATNGSLFVWNCNATKPPAAVAFAPAGQRTSTTVTLDVAGGGLCFATTTAMQVVADLTAAG